MTQKTFDSTITVKQLKEIIQDLPDDMEVGTFRRISEKNVLVACGFKSYSTNELFNLLCLE